MFVLSNKSARSSYFAGFEISGFPSMSITALLNVFPTRSSTTEILDTDECSNIKTNRKKNFRNASFPSCNSNWCYQGHRKSNISKII